MNSLCELCFVFCLSLKILIQFASFEVSRRPLLTGNASGVGSALCSHSPPVLLCSQCRKTSPACKCSASSPFILPRSMYAPLSVRFSPKGKPHPTTEESIEEKDASCWGALPPYAYRGGDFPLAKGSALCTPAGLRFAPPCCFARLRLAHPHLIANN